MKQITLGILLLSSLWAGVSCKNLDDSIADFRNQDLPTYRRTRALRAIANAGEEHIITGLRHDLRDAGNADARRRAAVAMGATGSFIYIPDLRDAAMDPNRSVAEAAREAYDAIARVPYPLLIEEIVAVLESGDDYVFRGAAAYTLGALRDQRVAGPLAARALDDQEDWFVRARAVEGLGLVGGHQALEALLLIAEGEDHELARHAARALEDLAQRLAQTRKATVYDLGEATRLQQEALDHLQRLYDRSEILQRQVEQITDDLKAIDAYFAGRDADAAPDQTTSAEVSPAEDAPEASE